MSDIDYGDMKYLYVKRLTETATFPTRNHSTDAGLDLYSDFTWSLRPLCGKLYPLGIAIEIEDGYAGFIWDRSGLGIKGVHRHCGVIDSSYRGEMAVYLLNHSDKTKQIFQGDRIAQLVIQKVELWGVREVDELTDTERGEKGFGSSGN